MGGRNTGRPVTVVLQVDDCNYTACHPRKTTTYIFHVVPITTHTHDRRKSIGKKEAIHRLESSAVEFRIPSLLEARRFISDIGTLSFFRFEPRYDFRYTLEIPIRYEIRRSKFFF